MQINVFRTSIDENGTPHHTFIGEHFVSIMPTPGSKLRLYGDLVVAVERVCAFGKEFAEQNASISATVYVS